MRPLFYLVYLLRRLSNRTPGNGELRQWSSTLVLLLVEIRLALALAYVLAPSHFGGDQSLGTAIVIGLVISMLTIFLLSDTERYTEAVAVFESWSQRKRIVADVATGVLAIIAIVSPLIARWIVTGKPWWA